MPHLTKSLPIIVLWLLVSFSPSLAQTPISGEAVVRAVLFYSPSCPHCQQVITKGLPPLLERYGDQLEILGVNAATEQGNALFQAAAERFKIDYLGVPLLVVGEVVLVGAKDIPEQFPGLIDKFLAHGGVDWPDIPGLVEAIQVDPGGATPKPQPSTPATPVPSSPASTNPVAPQETKPLPTLTDAPAPSSTPSSSALMIPADPPAGLWGRLSRDPYGNALAVIILIGMIVSVYHIARRLLRVKQASGSAITSSAIPILSLVGLGIAGYLAYVETTQVSAVCGPVGDCNTVQHSEYARLFGVLPVGVLGVIGYITILVAWLVGRFGSKSPARLASFTLLGVTLFGALFSIYLTFLEPFVIGATCAWCLASAILMTLLFWLTALPGIGRLFYGRRTIAIRRRR